MMYRYILLVVYDLGLVLAFRHDLRAEQRAKEKRT